MVKPFKKAFFVVGKKGKKKFFVRKPFPTREAGEMAIAKSREIAKRRAREIRASGRKVIPARVSAVRVIRRPKFGFRRRR